jgi:hypothetical protein
MNIAKFIIPEGGRLIIKIDKDYMEDSGELAANTLVTITRDNDDFVVQLTTEDEDEI